MNYITQLQQTVAAREGQIVQMDQLARSFREHINGPKFSGTEPNGDRKDWIATSDVNAFLESLLSVGGV